MANGVLREGALGGAGSVTEPSGARVGRFVHRDSRLFEFRHRR
jgi:hypothetical protein